MNQTVLFKIWGSLNDGTCHKRLSGQRECCCSSCIRQLASLYRLVPSFRLPHFHFRLRQAPSQQRTWRPARIGIPLLSPQQRSQEPECPTWQTETATKGKTSSSETYVGNISLRSGSGAVHFVAAEPVAGQLPASLLPLSGLVTLHC